VLDYFPDALLAVADVSRVGNEQHHPGEPLHWDKSKSTDEADALLRHLLDRGKTDTDGLRHTAKVAWRALALLQRELDAEARTTVTAARADHTHSTWTGPSGTEYTMPPLVTFDNRGEWPPDTRVNGLLTCCGQSEHPITCSQYRA
jgi:hypothetical protein